MPAPTIPIPRTVKDPYFRYRREPLIIDHRGKHGGQTVLLNISVIAKNIRVPHEKLIAHFKRNLGTSINEKGIIKGHIEYDKLEDALEEYIVKNCLCGRCGLPELRTDKTTKNRSCDACGFEILRKKKKNNKSKGNKGSNSNSDSDGLKNNHNNSNSDDTNDHSDGDDGGPGAPEDNNRSSKEKSLSLDNQICRLIHKIDDEVQRIKLSSSSIPSIPNNSLNSSVIISRPLSSPLLNEFEKLIAESWECRDEATLTIIANKFNLLRGSTNTNQSV